MGIVEGDRRAGLCKACCGGVNRRQIGLGVRPLPSFAYARLAWRMENFEAAAGGKNRPAPRRPAVHIDCDQTGSTVTPPRQGGIYFSDRIQCTSVFTSASLAFVFGGIGI